MFGYAPVVLSDVVEYRTDRIDASKVNEASYIGVDNLLANRNGRKQSEYVPAEGRLTRFEPNDILIGNIRPYLKKIWMSDMLGGTNGDVLAIKVKYQNSIYPRYIYHVLASDRFFAYDNQHAKGAKMPRGDKAAVMQYGFCLPEFDKQKNVAEILDKYDELCNDISSGLPAEIEARQEQYEYYRDKLLPFKEKEA